MVGLGMLEEVAMGREVWGSRCPGDVVPDML